MILIIIILFILSFFCTYFLTRWWIKRAKSIELMGKDMNKYDKPLVAEMGGLSVLISFIFIVLFFLGYNTFIKADISLNLEILAIIATISLIGIFGMIDDLLGWKIGLKQWQRPILCLFAALPIAMINVGHSIMALPFIGYVEFGIIYPIILIPIGISGAANGFNLIAGYNGLETGMGVIIIGTLGIVNWLIGNQTLAIVSFIMVASLIAFLIFNWYPAKVFPGDTLTYTVGALIAIIAILGNMEKIALFLFIPYFIDFILQARGKFKKEAFGMPHIDKSLEMPFKEDRFGIYHLTHLSLFLLKKIKNKVFERGVVLFIFLIEIILAMIVLIPFIV